MTPKRFVAKKLYMDPTRKRFVWCFMFEKLRAMQEAYKQLHPHDGQHFKTLGVFLPGELQKRPCRARCIGVIMLTVGACPASVACHEIMHAVMFNRNFPRKRYPLRIAGMDQEEELLYSLTHVTSQFYQWYWTIVRAGRDGMYLGTERNTKWEVWPTE